MPGVVALRPDSPPTSDCQKARRFLNSLEAQMLDLDGSRHSPTARAADRRNKAAMSALPPKADMCGATWDVRFGPKADICNAKKSVSAFRESRHSRSRLFNHLIGQIKNVLWDSKPNGLAILKLMMNSNLLGCSAGRSPGRAPLIILSTRIAAWNAVYLGARYL
jgi:hypothetical protein